MAILEIIEPGLAALAAGRPTAENIAAMRADLGTETAPTGSSARPAPGA